MGYGIVYGTGTWYDAYLYPSMRGIVSVVYRTLLMASSAVGCAWLAKSFFFYYPLRAPFIPLVFPDERS